MQRLAYQLNDRFSCHEMLNNKMSPIYSLYAVNVAQGSMLLKGQCYRGVRRIFERGI